MDAKEAVGIFKSCIGAFLTGTRAFGNPSSASDWDVCVLVGDREHAKNHLRLYNLPEGISIRDIEDSSYNNGFKGAVLDLNLTGPNIAKVPTVNVIPLHPHEMLCWYMTTNEITRLMQIPGTKDRLRNRELRHGLFESLCALYKMTIPYHGYEYSMYTLVCLQSGGIVQDYDAKADYVSITETILKESTEGAK